MVRPYFSNGIGYTRMSVCEYNVHTIKIIIELGFCTPPEEIMGYKHQRGSLSVH